MISSGFIIVPAWAWMSPALSAQVASVFRGGSRIQLFLCRVIAGIDVIDRPWPDAVNLRDRLFARPHIVVGPRLHDRDTCCFERAGLRRIEGAANAHMERPRNDGDVLDTGMPMWRHLKVGRELQPEHDWHRLIQRTLDDGDFHPGERGKIVPSEF